MTGSKFIASIGHRFKTMEPERRILEPLGYVLTDLSGLPLAQVREKTRDAEGILVGTSVRVDRDFITGLKACRGIVRYGIGLDNIDVDAAKERSIQVLNVTDYCIEEVANHAMSMLLALHRKLFEFNQGMVNGNWQVGNEGRSISRLSHCTLGLAGLGRIGREVAQRAQSFGLRVIAYDPYLPDGAAREAGVEMVTTLTDLIGESDFISLHMPITEENRHLLSARLLAGARKGACVINVSRGGLVDQAALAEALNTGRLGGAALDVFETEPLPAGDPIVQAKNVILTPHVAWISRQAGLELQEKAAAKLAGILEGTRGAEGGS